MFFFFQCLIALPKSYLQKYQKVFYILKMNILHIKLARKIKKMKYILIVSSFITHRSSCPNEDTQFTYVPNVNVPKYIYKKLSMIFI